ncbi:hypothetical protein DC366_04305 [Pelagivirga sediminicola]|uniref:Uncharacterized protein n=1 Tax=Pelagivirga sediminicola TaxID=2170575 RepID=A0A2T7G9B1_9RHOB|nr:hypothetical protein [Pelagivirga sediminicola]PVA11010.1 hypothetical protein DC366_04305 [Pelagivirga sediminicola]
MTGEHQPRADEERREFREEAESLWRITLAPVTWVAHFVASYGVAAVTCAKAPGLLGAARIGLMLATLLALAVIAWLGWRAWRQWDYRNTGDYTNALGQAEDRHQFLGHAAVLLALISAIGVVYGTLPVLLLDTCR